ncbi:MAG: RDD family protein [Planctomycetota bacterium]|nr:RDD family protein [Planctomycetota bacterium]
MSTPPPVPSQGHITYAGFWKRFIATIIDGFISGIVNFALLLPCLAIFGIAAATRTSDPMEEADAVTMIAVIFAYLGAVVGQFLFGWLYSALMESSSYQATVGKLVLGIRVTGMQGQRISFGRATGRYFGKVLSCMTLCIGFMLAGFTEKKQALHDLVAGCLVINKA